MKTKLQKLKVSIGSDDVDYLMFGEGNTALVIMPGISDGLSSVHTKLRSVALFINYKELSNKYRVYVFSRRNSLKDGTDTAEMADDQAAAMKALGIKNAMVLGISQGGMIAQHLAINYPDIISKLVLAVTLPKSNEQMKEAAGKWLDLAKQNKYKELLFDIAARSYSEKRLKAYKRLYPFVGRIDKPKDFSRFIIQAKSCATHDAKENLSKICCPTLIIAGAKDKITGPLAARELADAIKDSKLIIYGDIGHSVYEEADAFLPDICKFFAE
ncbi:MAG: alpha/beta hydrolase [Ruminococcaceae bacterium]|nr:alpha/beta hydrolase [Oscillospiraceae bacterium]